MDATTKRWQDGGNLVLGVWMFFSPWMLAYAAGMPLAAWNAVILGAAIVVFAAVAMYMPRVWEEGLNMALGVWLIVSPWALRFTAERSAMMNAVVVGILVAALAAWAMLRDKEFEKWWQDHHHAA
ncbi:SPW repeat protein [Herminiimonas sp. CN]|uniref:SPW repeat protein n=1 Tax=Herminiimonas sp. CN TaxID=1349818 RepID=UPI000AB5211D|nr:SPW repeat protein [Herminiimonas sp. CN]